MLPQCTHNLLTLQGETLYYNTNLGAVAALSTVAGAAALGQPVSPRAARRPAAAGAHWQRDLTPCLYHGGTLLVAPADSPRSSPWTPAPARCSGDIELEDATQLLGVGRRLPDRRRPAALLDRPDRASSAASSARLARRPGEAGLRPRRAGRRLRPLADAGENLRLRPADRGARRGRSTWPPSAPRGGNLLVADGRLLIATAQRVGRTGLPGQAQCPAADVAAMNFLREGRGQGMFDTGEKRTAKSWTAPHPNSLPKGEDLESAICTSAVITLRSNLIMLQENDIQAVQKLNEAYRLITEQLGRVIVGQQQVIEELLMAMFARGHCLLVGVPGLAKTLMIRTLADALSLELQPHPVHARPDARRHHRHGGDPGGQALRQRGSSSSSRARSSPT